MKPLLCAFLAAGLVTSAAPAKHKKHSRTAQTATADNATGKTTAQPNVGTKGFPPKPLPAADPRNPADPQKAPVNQRVTPSDSPTETAPAPRR